MTGGFTPAVGRLAPLARVAVVMSSTTIGWWLAGAEGPRLLAGVGGAVLALLAVGLELGLRSVDPRRVLGACAGLGIAWLLLRFLPEGAGVALAALGLPEYALSLMLALVLGWVGLVTGARELSRLDWSGSGARREERLSARLSATSPAPKVVDTSVIIDGRINDVVQSGFVEGPLVVPHFVIDELQHVADSSDPLRRARGRKGLDVLKELQDSDRIDVELVDHDFPEIEEVDGKLLALAEALNAKVLTTDYNLNKVAQLRGVIVLNVNDLANAVKPVVLPGECLSVQVIKEGKERNQGVGYLDDGTMIVVDNAGDMLGERLDVLVTSVIQTNAGKMIFASPDGEREEVRPRVVRRDERSSAALPPTSPGVRPRT